MPTDEQLDEFAKKAFCQPFSGLSADNRLKVIDLAIRAESNIYLKALLARLPGAIVLPGKKGTGK